MNTIKWLNKQRLKTMLQIVHIIWQNYSNKRIRNKNQFNIINSISRQQNLKNRIKKTGN
jgi:hypothetical protein